MPKSVLDKIIEDRKMPVLFIGSGISKRYLNNFPNWEELLKKSFNVVNPDPFYYGKYYEKLTRDGLSSFEINTKLGTIIENDFNNAFYDRKVKVNLGNSNNPKWLSQGVSPYKMYLVSIFKKLSITTNDELIKEIEAFKLLKNKISAVITTNYDNFLEKEVFANDYQVFCHQNELFSSDSYNIAEIYKIHGSVTDAKSLVITENDYANFNSSRKLIIAKMLTLFAESPIIFLGYSFTDENIQHIIEDFLTCLTKKELSSISDHFIFVSHKKGEKKLLETKRSIFTANKVEIPITEIATDNYLALFNKLNQITPGIAASRVRETKKIIKKIVDQSLSSDSAESIIVGLDQLDEISLSSKPLAVAIGYRDTILSQIGYGLLEIESIIEDIIYDNKNLDPDLMCFDRYKSINYTHLIPVFKYVSRCSSPILVDSKLYKYIDHWGGIDKIISNSTHKQLHSFPTVNNISELHYQISLHDTEDKKAAVLLKNICLLSIDEIRQECKTIFSLYNGSKITSAHFKRCVMYLDFLENSAKKS